MRFIIGGDVTNCEGSPNSAKKATRMNALHSDPLRYVTKEQRLRRGFSSCFRPERALNHSGREAGPRKAGGVRSMKRYVPGNSSPPAHRTSR